MDEIRERLEAAAAALREARDAGDADAVQAAQADVTRLTAELRAAQETDAALREADDLIAEHRADAERLADRTPVATADELIARQGDIEHARGTVNAGDIIMERVRAGTIEPVEGRPLGWIPHIVASQQPAEVLARGGDELVNEAIAEGRAFMAWMGAAGDTAAAAAALTSDADRTALNRLVTAQRRANDGPYAATVGTGTSGVPIPTQFVPQPVDEMGEIGLLGSRAERIMVTSAKGERPAFGTVGAGWIDDDAQFAEAEQTNRLIAFGLNLVGGYENVSTLADWASEPDLVGRYIAGAMRGIGRAVSNAVIRGTGAANNQPAGLAVGSNLAAGRKVATAANGTATWAEIVELVSKLTSFWLPGSQWYLSTFNRNELHSTEVNAQKGRISQALDGPIAGFPTNADDAAGFTNFGVDGQYAIFGNLMRAYAIFEPIGMPLMAAVADLTVNARAGRRVLVYAALDGRVTSQAAVALLHHV